MGGAIAYDPTINNINVALISEIDIYGKHEFNLKVYEQIIVYSETQI